MGDKTGIEWTDATWNPVTGCSKVSQGCKNCYAERVFARAYARARVPINFQGKTVMTRQRKFTDVQCHAERLDQPLRWKQPRKIFVNSMSDLFHDAVPDEFIFKVWSVMFHAHWHTFQVLTKRPERMAAWVIERNRHAKPNRNVWLGVSAEDQETFDDRVGWLSQTPAAVRFVSLEPLLGPIDSTAGLDPCAPDCQKQKVGEPPFSGHWHRGIESQVLHWVIVGGESGPGARPMHPDWARSLRDQCVAAGVPFFFKQWGEWAPVCAQYPRTEAEDQEADIASMEGDICMSDDGYIWEDGVQPSVTGRPWLMNRVGKKAAGSILDGREWRQFPGSEVEHHGA